MTVMKKKLIIIAVLVIALVTSYIFCGTDKNDTGIDSIKIEEYTAALSNKIDFYFVLLYPKDLRSSATFGRWSP